MIIQKAEKVKNAFLQLHEPLIGEELLLSSKSNIGNCDFRSADYEQLMDGIKQKCQDLKMKPESSIEIISLLTLAPVSWNRQQISTFFGVSDHLVRRSAILKREKGLLAKPDKKQGRPITEDEKEIVRDFYLCDENSRQLPGMKDYISVRTRKGEKNQKVQKRLVLMNINELYVKYKEYCEHTLYLKSCGRSTFFMLRPCNVIEVGSSGSHNVCVCEKHQNVHLMVDTICGSNKEKLLLMDKVVCDILNQECMLKRCPRCPGTEPLKTFLTNIVANIPVIKFNQWETTDRSMLVQKELRNNDFVEELAKKIDTLTSHHIISKEQGKYCKELKARLLENECILQGDFSQNYSMIAQDSTQSSYFNPASQATIHTYLAILNVAGKISNHSICVISDYMGIILLLYFHF